jgi:tetratricopeptide (TPR) repeat protein
MFKSKLLLASILMLAVVSSYSQEHLPLINSAILIQEGSKLHDEGKYREAIKVYDRITSADSNYVLALYEKALSCQADSQFQQGLKYAEEGLRLTSDREREPVLYTIYGSLLDDLNEYDRALRVFDSAIAVYPAHTPLYVNKVITLLKKDYAKAEAVTRQALLQDPFSASLHYYHGYLSYQKGEIIPAVLSYTTYLLVLPGGKNSGRVINLLGMIARNENEVGELVAKRTSETPPNFQVLEQIIASKIALDKKYKRQTSLDDPICRQLQVMLEKLEYD